MAVNPPEKATSFYGLQAMIDASGQGPRTPPEYAIVYNPITEEEHRMTVQNARDRVRIDGWKLVEIVRPDPVLIEEIEHDDEEEVEEAREVEQRFAELDKLRAKYEELAGKPADKRWGKKKLAEKIALLS